MRAVVISGNGVEVRQAVLSTGSPYRYPDAAGWLPDDCPAIAAALSLPAAS